MAEQLSDIIVQDENLKWAVEVLNAEFTWDSLPSEVKAGNAKQGIHNQNEKTVLAQVDSPEEEVSVFQLKDVNMEIPRGALVAIVGPVGSGKSSLLQGLIGEMRRSAGTVAFGGSVSYCPQNAWIQVSSYGSIVRMAAPHTFS